MKLQRISRLLWLALGLTVLEHSTNMAQAQTTDPVVSAIQIISTTVNTATNRYSPQMKQESEVFASTNWISGQACGAINTNSTIQYSYTNGAWVTNSIYRNTNITSWPQGTTGTVATTSYSWTPMTNSTTASSGTAAAFVPPANGWEYAFGDVQVTTDPTYNPTGTNKVTKTAKAILELKTNGGTNYGASSLFKLTASASQRVVTLQTNGFPPNFYITTNISWIPVPPANIAVLGLDGTNTMSFDTNGFLFVGLLNAATYTLQPVLPAQYRNYTFNLRAERVLIHIGMRTINQITPYTTNASLNGMVGPIYYTNLINYMGSTNLGLGPVTQPGMGKNISNLAEFTAGVPDDPIFNSGWVWHRDGDGVEEYWRTGGTNTTNLDTKVPKNGPIGSDDPPPYQTNTNSVSSNVPDAARVLYSHDAPSLRTADIDYPAAPVGSVFAKRFNARQWLTWNGVVVSDILYWHAQVTIKKTTGNPGWIRVGPNEIGEGLLPSIGFTASEASQY